MVVSQTKRRVFIAPDGNRIPLLTDHYALHYPVLEEVGITFQCPCSWIDTLPEI